MDLIRVKFYDGEIQATKVEIIRETPKMLFLKGAGRASIRKDEVGLYFPFDEIYCEPHTLKEIVEAYVTKRIDTISEKVEKLANEKANFLKSLERLEVYLSSAEK